MRFKSAGVTATKPAILALPLKAHGNAYWPDMDGVTTMTCSIFNVAIMAYEPQSTVNTARNHRSLKPHIHAFTDGCIALRPNIGLRAVTSMNAALNGVDTVPVDRAYPGRSSATTRNPAFAAQPSPGMR
eukprot:TRINITY_DN10327_c0_g3_i1.p2 TRINITY_DN10327_c0_g3~~TRINITY_DN10327_c0_g3_i1.p2  ORF type:complete len:129 (+),score=6.35 TRINITY_DN10327_c0_g3_i1:1016-1402(+)